jgi:hypothetical protein
MKEEGQHYLKSLLEQQLAYLVSRAELTLAELLDSTADEHGDFFRSCRSRI